MVKLADKALERIKDVLVAYLESLADADKIDRADIAEESTKTSLSVTPHIGDACRICVWFVPEPFLPLGASFGSNLYGSTDRRPMNLFFSDSQLGMPRLPFN